MFDHTLGLVSVETELLRQLLRHVHRGEILAPMTPAKLAPMGFQHHSEALMGTLRGLDDAGVRAVLVAVLAERMNR